MQRHASFLRTSLLGVGLWLLAPLSAPAQYYGQPDPLTGRWLVGVSLGHGWVHGDVQPVVPGFQACLYAQRTVVRVFDVHLGLALAQLAGQDLSAQRNTAPNPALNGLYNPGLGYDPADPVYHNYRLRGGDLIFSGRLQLSRLFSQQGQENWDFYLGAGAGAQFYRTWIDAFDAETSAPYPYAEIAGENPGDLRRALILMRDGTFETLAERDVVNSTIVRGYTINSAFLLCSGLRFQLGDKIGLGLEARALIVQDDLLDGLQWSPDGSLSPDNDHIYSLVLTWDFSL